MTRVRSNSSFRTLPPANHSSSFDPALLLARGYTARHIGAVLHHRGAKILSHDEIEHDLQHIVAYQEASTRYHQITYANANRLEKGGATTDSPQEPLPVKIDPDQEKRAEAQRKRIQRAEAVREELEQHYVSLRAHYVMTTQTLHKVQKDSFKTIEFLQHTVANLSKAMGLQRARLQIVRDVLAALKGRSQNPITQEMPLDNSHCPMTALWGNVEEEIRKVWVKQNTMTRKSSKTNSTLPWHATMEPSTIKGVPQLVSNISTAPDKSLGITTSGAFDALDSSLLWFESHLPRPSGDDMDAKNAALEAEAIALEKELHKERELNQVILNNSGRARLQHDEWVAMISLVRQETEAVLHRHNVLLESDEVQKAIAEAPSTEGGDVEEDEEDDLEEDVANEEGQVVDSVPPHQPEGGDEANEADDEGMVEDEEESETNGKRAATDDDAPRKRRKV